MKKVSVILVGSLVLSASLVGCGSKATNNSMPNHTNITATNNVAQVNTDTSKKDNQNALSQIEKYLGSINDNTNLSKEQVSFILKQLNGDWYNNIGLELLTSGVESSSSVNSGPTAIKFTDSDLSIAEIYPDTGAINNIISIKKISGSKLTIVTKESNTWVIEFIGDTGINISKDKDWSNIVFIKIDDLNKYVNDNLLVGKYLDSKGNEYKFSSDWLANWNGKSFKYEVDVNSLELSYNPCIIELDSNGKQKNRYIFENLKGKLKIYTTKQKEKQYESDTAFEKDKLLLELTKMK